MANSATEQSTGGNDAALIAQLGAGNLHEPLTELYRRYGGLLYGYGRKHLLDDGLAEELVQETFVRLWRTAGRFNPDRGTVRGYMFTIATTIAVDLRRRPSSRGHDPEPGNDAVLVPDPAEGVAQAVTVREALDALSPAHRTVLTLAHAQDLTQRQIAAELNIPIGTVKTRLYHGLRAFRDALQQRGIHTDH